MQSSLMTAFALFLVIEGLLPLLSPASWREMFQRIIAFEDGQIRFVGLVSMLSGLALLYFAY